MKAISQKIMLIEQLKKTPVVQIACERVGISRAIYYVWRKKDKKFAEEADKAIIDGATLINDMAEAQLISAIKNQNFQAIHLWLRHHHPNYADKIEIKGQIDSSDEKLTPKQAAIVKAALKLARFGKNYEQQT